jgi:hypothetical protein
MKKLFLTLLTGYFVLMGMGIPLILSTSASPSLPPLVGHKDAKGKTMLPGPESGDPNAAQEYVNNSLLPGLTNFGFVFILSISVGAIVIAGIFYVYSMGDSEQTKKAKDIIMWTVIGIFIAAISYTVISIIINTDFIN